MDYESEETISRGEGLEYEASTYELMRMMMQDEYLNAESRAVPKPDPEPGPEAEPEAESNAEPEANPEVEPEVEPQAEQQAEPHAEQEAEGKADADVDDNETTTSTSTFRDIEKSPPANGMTYYDPDKDFVCAAMEAAISATSKLAGWMVWQSSSPTMPGAGDQLVPPSTSIAIAPQSLQESEISGARDQSLPPSNEIDSSSLQESLIADAGSEPLPSSNSLTIDPISLKESFRAKETTHKQTLKESITDQILVSLGFKMATQATVAGPTEDPNQGKCQKSPTEAPAVQESESNGAINGSVRFATDEEETTSGNESFPVMEESEKVHANVESMNENERLAVTMDLEQLMNNDERERIAIRDSWSKTDSNSLLDNENDDFTMKWDECKEEYDAVKHRDDSKNAEVMKAMVIKCLIRNQYVSKTQDRKGGVSNKRQPNSESSQLDQESQTNLRRDPSTQSDAADKVEASRDPPETGRSDHSVSGSHTTTPRQIRRNVFPRPEMSRTNWAQPSMHSPSAHRSNARVAPAQTVPSQLAFDQQRANALFSRFSPSVHGSTPIPAQVVQSQFDKKKAKEILNGSALMRRRHYKELLMKQKANQNFATE